MRRTVSLFLALVLMLTLFGCGKKDGGTAWQEQYDLGVRYLSEENYKEAIIAFETAIEIDPKRADSYIGLADVYIQQGDYEKAQEILRIGLEKTAGSQVLTDKLSEISDHSVDDIDGLLIKSLQAENSLAYGDIPKLFSMDFDNLESFWGLPLHSKLETTQTGSINGKEYSYPTTQCYYGSDYGSTVMGNSSALPNTHSVIDASMSTSFEEDWGMPTGWLDICFGDDYVTVLRKLHIDENTAKALEAYKYIEIQIYENEYAYGWAHESGAIVNGVPLPQIYIAFYASDLDKGRRVCIEFADGEHMDRIIYRNQTLFSEIVGE